MTRGEQWRWRRVPATAQEIPNPLRGQYEDRLKRFSRKLIPHSDNILPGLSRMMPACVCRGGNCNQPTHRTRDRTVLSRIQRALLPA
jgi:hypothetical protein